ncbi:aldo/keto reductase [Microbacterium sp. KKR3/1]|uniref:aldo/keto reductase n=1 Tax=Microbacterium sp. KKR3/1 TaxID=2904241 RepID=UPI001E3EE2B5|nr:aldo/keto reductase [Microbacterium sp. KKR3/1]MCE0509915.1 aldo/keto reductase [Microbacterium sp. KKR3/1]
MMPNRAIGDLRVSAIGMGAMTLTQVPDADVERGVRAVHAAVDAGITLFDTADSYGPTGEMGVNECALIEALRRHPDALERVVIATKGGHTRGPAATWWVDGSPEHLAAAARASAQRLGLDALPLYQHHRPDVRVPFEESMGAMRQLVDEGVVMRVGVSNVDVAQLEIARRVLGDALVSVQNEYSVQERSSEPVLRRCEELGLAFLAWGPLGGMRAAKELGGTAASAGMVAERHGVSPQRVVLAWLLSLSPILIPIPGASRAQSVRDSAASVDLALDDDDLRLLGTGLRGVGQ